MKQFTYKDPYNIPNFEYLFILNAFIYNYINLVKSYFFILADFSDSYKFLFNFFVFKSV